MLKKELFYIVLSIFLISLFTANGCSDSPRERSTQHSEKIVTKLEMIKKAGKIILGTTINYPPYEFQMLGNKDGNVYGVDIDIAEAIAKKLGVKLEIKIFQFNELLDALKTDKVDIVIAALSPTEKRKKVVDFSMPYYKADHCLLIKKKDSTVINSINDLKGKKLGIQIASSHMELATKYICDAQFVEGEDLAQLTSHLAKGRCDAVMLDKPAADSFSLNYSNLESKACFFDQEKSVLGAAVAVKKGETALVTEINSIISNLIQSRQIDEYVEKSKILTADVVR